MLNINPFNTVAVLVALMSAVMLLPVHPSLTAGMVAVAVFLVVYTMFRFRGRTWRQWRQLAKHRKTTTRTDAYLFSTRRNAVTWDGNRLNMFLELTPPPYHVLSLREGDGEYEGIPELPLDVIARSLRQYDITVDHVSVISSGFVTASNEPYDIVYASTTSLGQLSRFRTVIEVSIRLATSLNSVDARRGKGEGPEVGAARVVYVSTQRLMRSLIDAGWGARPLTTRELEAIDTEVSGYFGDSFEHERRTEMGENTISKVYSSRTSNVDLERIPATAASITVARVLTPHRHGRVHMDTIVALTGEDREDVTAGKGFSTEVGVQGDLLSQLLPLAPFVDTLRQNTLVHLNDRDVEPAGQAIGAGIALGERKGRSQDKIFMTLSGAKGTVLHAYVGPIQLRTMIMRMAAAGEYVSIELPDADGEWSSWVRAVGSERIAFQSERGGNTVRFIDAGNRVEALSSMITVAVCTSPPPRTARYTLTVGNEANLFVLSTPEDVTYFYATADQREHPWLNVR